MLSQCGQHDVTLDAITCDGFGNLCVEKLGRQQVHDSLVDGGAVEVTALFDDRKAADDFVGRADSANTKAWREDLRE